MKKLFKKIGNFFKWIWANKNSILAIITSVAAICLAIFIVLKGELLKIDFLSGILYTPEVKEVISEAVPAVLAGEADVVVGINVGDILVAEIPAVYEGEVLISEAIPAVLATEADVVAAVNIGDILVPEIPAVYGEVISAACINVYGYIVLGILACGICALDIYGIVNHYGIESVEQFAARLEEKKAEVEEKLATKEQKAEYKSKLGIFKKGLKEVEKKICVAEGKIAELKTLIDNKLATTEQIASYNSLNSEVQSLKALESNYKAKIEEVK